MGLSLLLLLAAVTHTDGQEAFARRACKFRPLPSDLNDGYEGLDGSVHIDEVFGLPVAALSGKGHNVSLVVQEGSPQWLGLSTQIPFSSSVHLQVEMRKFLRSGVGGHNLHASNDVVTCRHTWGAGGPHKQCVIEHVELPVGRVQLSFRASNAGDEAVSADGAAAPSSCLSVRLDLELVGRDVVESAKKCNEGQHPPEPLQWKDGQVKLDVATYSVGHLGVGVPLWRSDVPTGETDSGLQSAATPMLALLAASVNFASWVVPVQLLVEELEPLRALPWSKEDSMPARPRCKRRCWSGTATPSGQVLRRLVPVNVRYRMWLLGPYISMQGCNNFDFQVSRQLVPAVDIQKHFLGPPAWLCEGAVWPAMYTQKVPSVVDGSYGAPYSDMEDVFDLTMPHSGQDASNGVHAIDLVVDAPSTLHLTAYASSIPARPVLLRCPASEAWRNVGTSAEFASARIPTSVGEDDLHTIHEILQPGQYSLAFLLEIPVGGLRPCAQVRLRLSLRPVASLGRPCTADVSQVDFSQQLKAPWSRPLDFSMAQRFTVRLSRPSADSAPLPALEGMGLIAVATGSLSALQQKEATLVRAAVESDAKVDLFIQVFVNGEPQAEYQRLRSALLPSGEGHVVVAGPYSRTVEYTVAVFHRPVKAEEEEGCINVAIDIAAKTLSLATSVELLPGAAVCQLAALPLPKLLQVSEEEPLTYEGEFSLPGTLEHVIKLRKQTAGPVAVRVYASSRDAVVQITLSSRARAEGRDEREDMQVVVWDESVEANGAELPIYLSIHRALTPFGCPTVKLHVVAVHITDLFNCPSTYGLSLQQELESAMVRTAARPGQEIGLNAFHGFLRGHDQASVFFDLSSPSTELRFELGLYPGLFPLEVSVALVTMMEVEWQRAAPSGHRFVLNTPSLPPGKYVLRVRLWPELEPAYATSFAEKCTLVKGAVLLADPEDHDTSNIRQEMLNQPDLLPVSWLPTSLAFRTRPPSALHLYSQIFALESQGSTTSVHILEDSVFRLLAEPADILMRALTLMVTDDQGQLVEQASDTMGGTVLRMKPGAYRITLTPTTFGAPAAAFIVTVGFAPVSLFNTASSKLKCTTVAGTLPEISIGSAPRAHFAVRSWRRVQHINTRGNLVAQTVPFRVEWPAVVTIAAWSNFIFRYVRVGLKTLEGLWVGEQRLQVSALEIELPPGNYLLQIEESNPLYEMSSACFSFGVAMSQSSFTAPPLRLSALHGEGLSVADVTSRSLGVGARCDGLGASPLPLDFHSNSGGSERFGGPLDPQGRLLIRQRFLLTDIHDGRKKVFVKVPLSGFLRLAVAAGDASSVEVTLEDAEHHARAPLASWTDGSQGWSATYRVDAGSSWWLNFHREHRDASASSCASFDLLVQIMPNTDVQRMTACYVDSHSLADLLQHALVTGRAQGYISLAAASDTASAQVELPVLKETLLEVEVAHNFFLSRVDAWLALESGGHRASPVGATGASDSPLNAHALFQHRMMPGKHTLHVEVAAALGQLQQTICLPILVSIRMVDYDLGMRLAPLAGLAMPLPMDEDLVVVAASGDAQRGGQGVTVGGVPPRTLSRTTDSSVWVAVWEGSTLAAAAGGDMHGRKVPADVGGGGTLKSLPLQLGPTGPILGDVWVSQLELAVAPWSGEPRENLLSAPSRPMTAATTLGSGTSSHPSAGIPEHFLGEAAKLSTKGQMEVERMRMTQGLPTSRESHSSSLPSLWGWLVHILGWLLVLALCFCLATRAHLAKPMLAVVRSWVTSNAGQWGKSRTSVSREMASVVEITRTGTGYGSTTG